MIQPLALAAQLQLRPCIVQRLFALGSLDQFEGWEDVGASSCFVEAVQENASLVLVDGFHQLRDVQGTVVARA